MSNLPQARAQQDAFLKAWPVQRVKDMELSAYTDIERKDSFCYWIEVKTDLNGSIKGGSAYKFGIFRRERSEPLKASHLMTDGTYAWYQKYGKTADAAFSHIKQLIISILDAAKTADWSAIDTVDMGDAVKWKIAYLYASEGLLPIYAKKALIKISLQSGLEGTRQAAISTIQHFLVQQKPEGLHPIDYAQELWNNYMRMAPEDKEVSASHDTFSPAEHCAAKTLFSALEILDEAGGALPKSEVLQRIKERVGLSEWDTSVATDSGTIRWHRVLERHSQMAVKSGLLRKGPFAWRISQAGKDILSQSPYDLLAKVHAADQAPPPSVAESPASYKRKRHFPTYDIQHLLKESFLDEATLTSLSELIRHKQNVILQGPPGVGKTFLAKRLAYMMMGTKDKDRVSWVQFHPSYAYEDFVQGIRPNEAGEFELQAGSFFRFCKKAQEDPNRDYFFIIDEINRGHLGKVLGELMMLLEPDKRGPSHAIGLTYSRSGNTFFVPENLYLIGTMNTADRSLAMVDYAMRRRFAFFTLDPLFNDKFQASLKQKGVPPRLLSQLIRRIQHLNQVITADAQLGPGFVIGHSYFCPTAPLKDAKAWYHRIIDWEIAPLLQAYWFDDLTKAADEVERLREV